MAAIDEVRARLPRLAGGIPDEPVEPPQRQLSERHLRMVAEMEAFDWVTLSPPSAPAEIGRPYLMFLAPSSESPQERRLRMLEHVKRSCMACTMCELGRKPATRDGKLLRDPHVFSSMTPTRFMVVGQNPGWNEVCQSEPFVGDSGANFDAEVAANGLAREDFYICNTVRCYTAGNERPLEKHVQRCRPFLDIEMNLIRPLLVAALGAVAFDRLCPGSRFSDALGGITDSPLYEVPVFALYHPSPLNLKDPDVAAAFKDQMRLLCGLVKRMKARPDAA